MGRVKIQRNFPPEIAERLETMDETELATLLGVVKLSTDSKWTRMMARIDNDPALKDPEFQAAWRQMKADMRQWRENFEFNHDQET